MDNDKHCEELCVDLEQEIATRRQLIGSAYSKLIKGTTEEGYTAIEIGEFEYPSPQYDVDALEKYRDDLQENGYCKKRMVITPKTQARYLTRFSPVTLRLIDNMKRESDEKREIDMSSVACPGMLKVLDGQIRKMDNFLDHKIEEELDRLQPRNPGVSRSRLKRLADLIVAGNPKNVPLVYQSAMLRSYKEEVIKKAKDMKRG